MKYFISINIFLPQCLSVYSQDQDINVVVRENNPVRRVQEGMTPVGVPVSYTCEFINLWTDIRHPNQFPSDDHWSPMVMASHDNRYTMWAAGTKATQGVENVAEVGSTSVLRSELTAASGMVKSIETASSGLYPSDSNQSRVITSNLRMDQGHRRISAISMIAPSPDWFTGLNRYRPITSGRWQDSFVVDSYPWDAGTENGIGYSLSNSATSPQADITEITVDTVPSSGVFLNAEENGVLPVAQWSCTLNAVECAEQKKARFFRARKINSETGEMENMSQTCRWLSKKQSRINKFCNRNEGRTWLRPAKEVCRVTCGMCTP